MRTLSNADARDVAGGECRVERRHSEEQRGPGLLQPLAYDVRGRPTRLEDGGRADGEREEHGVPDAVGEEHLRHRERRVVGGDPEHLGAVRLADVPDVRVPVHGRLGQARRAGGVEPQRPRVVDGRRDTRVALVAEGREVVPGVPGDGAREVERPVAGQDGVLDVRGHGEGLAHRAGELRGRQDRPCARVGHDLAELGAGEHRGDRDRDEAGTEGAQEAREHRDLVAHHQHHPVVATQAEGTQPGRHHAHPLVEVGVGERLRGEDRGPVPGPGGDVPGDEVLRGVEPVGHGAHTRL